MDAVEEVKSRLNIEDVVGEYVQLKRSGRNYKGLSPFTNEKTPSFMVSPEKQIWHDFSSGRGGNVFSFVMEIEGLDFKGALELLARKAGVDLESDRKSGSKTAEHKDRLRAALHDATNFYQRALTRNELALTYVRKKRGFTKETILEFRLGYAPNDDTLTKWLLDKGYTVKELKTAGLSTERARGLSDMFRGRLMIPLMDPQGAVIGFTARLVSDNDSGPKYINTPSTPLYDKSRHIYGLSQAKQAIRQTSFVVVAEGNLDVITSHQSGVRQVVATAGTAMTSQHFAQLKRFTGDVRLSFDSDRAGQAATERAIPLAQAAGVNLSIIELPEGKDPDELIKKDASLWQSTIEKPVYAVDWLIEQYVRELDVESAVGKRRLTDVVLSVVRKLHDPVEQDHYLSKLSSIVGASPEALRSKLSQESSPKRATRRAPPNTLKPTSLSDYDKRIQHFLGIMLLFPSLRTLLQDLPEDMFTDEALKVYTVLSSTDMTSSETLVADLKDSADYVKMLALLAEEGYGRTDPEELRYQTEQLRTRLVAEYIRTKKQLLATKMVEEPTLQDQLLAEVKILDELQKTLSK